MYIIAKHAISDPDQVRAIIAAAELPADLILHQVLSNAAGTEQVCLWEAGSVEDVSAFVDPALAGVSRNTYFAVDESSAVGLPVNADAR